MISNLQLHQSWKRDLFLIFSLAFSFRLALLLFFPAPYGNDAAGRLYFRDTLWIVHWLPVTQTLVNFSFAATHSVFMVRLMFALVTSLAAAAFTFYLQAFAGRRAALIGGVLFSLNAQLVFLSLMPYQEVVFLGLLFGALAFFVRAELSSTQKSFFITGSLLSGLACLTRYEAWFILPFLLLGCIWQKRKSPRLAAVIATSVIGFCWAPALWLLLNWQKWSAPGAFLFHRADHAFYAWAPHGEVARIASYLGLMLYWLFRFGSPFVLLAVPGAMVFWKNRRMLFPILWPLLLLNFLVMIFLMFFAGREFATANRFASIPLSLVIIFTALGADELWKLVERSQSRLFNIVQQPRLKFFATAFVVLFLLFYGAVPVTKANQHPEFRAPYEVAKFLTVNLHADERAVMVAESLDGAVPMPYQRVFGQLELDQDRLRCAALLDPQSIGEIEEYIRTNRVRYLVVFEGDWQRQKSDLIFQQLLASSSLSVHVAFQSHDAVIYDLFPYLRQPSPVNRSDSLLQTVDN